MLAISTVAWLFRRPVISTFFNIYKKIKWNNVYLLSEPHLEKKFADRLQYKNFPKNERGHQLISIF